MPGCAAQLSLREEDVVRLSLEFLNSRELHISQLSLERETGVINGAYSDDVLFLRQLILDGQWDDVLEFIQPLEAIQAFDMRRFRYSILRHKYVELLCIKSEALGAVGVPAGQTLGPVAAASVDSAVEDVVKVLNELERVAPCKDDYSNLCLLLTLPRLSDHMHYKDWNPSNARVQCFREVYPLVEKFLIGDKKLEQGCARNDRLIHLIIKGILYESCVAYCQAKATGDTSTAPSEMTFSKLLDGSLTYSDSDLSLLSWLQSIPADTFSVPFEQRTLNVDIERLERPSLETSWTEHMLVTPIKPKLFPHSAMGFTRPRSAADVMSRSLLPHLDGLVCPMAGALSGGARHSPTSDAGTAAAAAAAVAARGLMSRSSFASFHLTGYGGKTLGGGTAVGGGKATAMHTSVDRLFENDDEVFLSSSYADMPQPTLPAIIESAATAAANTNKGPQAPPRTGRARSRSPEKKASTNTNASSGAGGTSLASTPEHRGRESPGSSTARSSRRDSLTASGAALAPTPVIEAAATPGGELLKEFQRQRQRVQDNLAARERDRDELVRQLTDAARITDNNGSTRQSSNNNNVSMNNGGPPDAGGMTHSGNNNSHTNGHRPTDQSVTIDVSTDSIKASSGGSRPRFIPVTVLEDVQAVRCAEFHPNGKLYAVGSNSKTLRICGYPKLNIKEDHESHQPTVLFKRTKHHKGSIYCLAWSPAGDLLATGSNDKTVKLMRFNSDTSNLEGQEIELTMHDGTVRDLAFLEDISNKSSLLISAGAGDCKIYVTDCATGTPFQALSGHTGHVLTLYTWGGAMFASGSQDKTVRFWDLRTRGCVNMVTPATAPASRGSPVAAVCVDPSGRLLVSGHEDSSCVLFDIRGGRNVQCFKPHAADVRSIRFSPSAYYLLTGGYDNKLVLTDLQGDLTLALPSVVVAQHQDKVISGRWHPTEFSFLSTSADKTASLWALPPV